MWVTAVIATLLLGVASERVLGAPTPTKLDDDETRSFWKGWLLLDDPSLSPEDGGRKKGQITPKSVFIAPVIKDLPDCAPGYRADALGRCHRLVKLDQSAQLSFLLQKLNSMYANNDKFIKKSPQATTEGPLHVAIPLFASVQTTPTSVSTTQAPPSTTDVAVSTTEAPVTEEVEVVVVAAQVEVKDDENSTSIPGAIVTLWHLNTTTEEPPIPADTVTLSQPNMTTEEPTTTTEVETTVTSTPSTIQDDTTTSDIPTLSTDEDNTSTITDSTETTINTSETEEQESTSSEVETTTEEINFSSITETIPPSPPKIFSLFPSRISPGLLTTPSPSTLSSSSTTELSLLNVHRVDSDIRIVDSSDLSSETSDVKSVTLPIPGITASGHSDSTLPDEGQSEVTLPFQGHSDSTLPVQGGSDSTLPVEGQIDVTLSGQGQNEGQRLRWPQSQDLNTGWSWGQWPTTQRPVYLNFWSSLPQIEPTVRTRTTLRRPQNRYPASASFNGRPGSFFYRELTGQDVANVFRQPWQHG